MGTATNSYVDEAKSVIESINKKIKEENIAVKNRKMNKNQRETEPLTTSKIRNLLQLVMDIYNDVSHSKEDSLNDSQIDSIEYLKVRFIYESGREQKSVGYFVKQAEIIDKINKIGNSKKEYIDFTRYMEALVAYHKFYGGID